MVNCKVSPGPPADPRLRKALSRLGGSLARSSSSPNSWEVILAGEPSNPSSRLQRLEHRVSGDTVWEQSLSGSTEPWRTGRENRRPVKRSWRWGPRDPVMSVKGRKRKREREKTALPTSFHMEATRPQTSHPLPATLIAVGAGFNMNVSRSWITSLNF